MLEILLSENKCLFALGGAVNLSKKLTLTKTIIHSGSSTVTYCSFTINYRHIDYYYPRTKCTLPRPSKFPKTVSRLMKLSLLSRLSDHLLPHLSLSLSTTLSFLSVSLAIYAYLRVVDIARLVFSQITCMQQSSAKGGTHCVPVIIIIDRCDRLMRLSSRKHASRDSLFY